MGLQTANGPGGLETGFVLQGRFVIQFFFKNNRRLGKKRFDLVRCDLEQIGQLALDVRTGNLGLNMAVEDEALALHDVPRMAYSMSNRRSKSIYPYQ